MANSSNITLRNIVSRPLTYEELDANFQELIFTIDDTNSHVDSDTAHNASSIVYDPSNSDLTSDNVQDAIDEHVESTSAHASEDITYDNSNSSLGSSTVKDALDELGIKNNPSATSDPTANDDSTQGYKPFSRWINTSTNEIFICLDATTGSANWQQATLTIDELGSAAIVDMGTGSNQIRTNAENEALFIDEETATSIAENQSILYSIALG